MRTGVAVQITRWLDDEPQPGLIEFKLTDSSGAEWLFREKVPIASYEMLNSTSVFPRPGSIDCRIVSRGVDALGRAIVEIEVRHLVSSPNELDRFHVFADQVS